MSTDHKSEALQLAQRLTQGWGLELAQDAAAELRRLAAVEAERDALRAAREADRAAMWKALHAAEGAFAVLSSSLVLKEAIAALRERLGEQQ